MAKSKGVKKADAKPHFIALKFAAVAVVMAALVTIGAATFVFVLQSQYAYGTLLGVMFLLIFIIVAGFQLTMVRALWRVEQGTWKSLINFSLISILARAFLAYTLFTAHERWVHSTQHKPEDLSLTYVMYICAIFLAIEFLIFILIYVRRKAFMPTAEEIQEAMKKVSGPTVKTVSECPNCREIIEKDWASCPQCGTRLPRHCANCGFELLTKTEKCPNCGVTVEKAETVQKQIGTLKKISEEEARPEAMSVRYARLAEAYLKAGEVDQALDNYKEAIHFTAFDRKRSNFMVKMATIMHNSGRNDEAIQILDAAMQLDPSDAAGAALTKNRIAAHGLVQAAQAALDKGNESEALRLADEALKTDMTDYYRAAGLRGMITARELVRKAEEAIASMNQEAAAKLLDDAIRLDPTGRTNARTLRDQVEVQRGSKVKK